MFICVAYEAIDHQIIVPRRWGCGHTKDHAFQLCWSEVTEMLKRRSWIRADRILYSIKKEGEYHVPLSPDYSPAEEPKETSLSPVI